MEYPLSCWMRVKFVDNLYFGDYYQVVIVTFLLGDRYEENY